MTAPDSPAVARLRALAAAFRLLAESTTGDEAAGAAERAEALDGVLAELDEARRVAVRWQALATPPRIGANPVDHCPDACDGPECDCPPRVGGACPAHAWHHAAGHLAAELAEARRQPRVWLEGDTVPAGLVVIPASGYAFRTGPGPYRVQFDPLVEAVDYAAAVAAERKRRTIVAEGPAQPSSATEPSEAGSSGSVDVGPVPAPVERMRSAADELERRAAAATPGRWQPEYGYLNRSRVQAVFVECGAQDGCDGVDCTHGIGGFDLDGDNRWAILANPTLAKPLAALLRAEADRPTRTAWDDQVLAKAADLADQILRGAS